MPPAAVTGSSHVKLMLVLVISEPETLLAETAAGAVATGRLVL
jgi:hypothetical protein